MWLLGSTKQEISASSLDLAPTVVSSFVNDFSRNARPYLGQSAHETSLVDIERIRFHFGGDLGAFKGVASSFPTESKRFDEFRNKVYKFSTSFAIE